MCRVSVLSRPVALLIGGLTAACARVTTTPAPAIQWSGMAEMIASDPTIFAEDPNVEGAAAEALGVLTSVPLRYISVHLSRVLTVSRISTRVTWEFAREQHLASRGAVHAEYLVVVPADANVTVARDPTLFNRAIQSITEESLTDVTRSTVADRAGGWTYIVTVTRIFWGQASGACMQLPFSAAFVIALAAAVSSAMVTPV